MGKPVSLMFPIERGLKGIGICPYCNKPVNEKDFKNKASKKEFKISGLCQKCQDIVFK